MGDFSYIHAADLHSAYAALEQYGATALTVAGGTNVLPLIRAGKSGDRALINIHDIDQLRGIRQEQDRIIIGSLTTIAALAASDLLRQKAPVLWQAANVFADPTTRNSATVGGNLGFASPAADSAPPLLALGAELLLGSASGQRRMPLDEFFVGVNRNALQPNELILAVEFPANSHCAFYKLGLRNAMAISVASAAAALSCDGSGRIQEVKIAMGSVAPRPVRCLHTEQALTGQAVGDGLLPLIEAALAQDISPIDDIRASAAYRLAVAPELVLRTVKKAAGCACGEDKEALI